MAHGLLSFRHSFCTALTLLIATSSVHSQTDPNTRYPALTTLPAFSEVRFETRRQSIVFGRYLRTSRDTVLITTSGEARAERALALKDITRAWFHNGSQVGKGMILGAGIGVATGLVLALSGNGAGDLTRGQVATIFAVLFGGAGLVTGMFIGASQERWDPVNTQPVP